jgi:hypothetical protein
VLDVLSLGRGVRLGLVVAGEGRAPGSCACGDLVYDYTSLQYRSFKLDMQETSATEVCESPSSPSKLESLSGQRDSKSAGVSSRHARKKRHCCARVLHPSRFGYSSIHSKFLAHLFD